MFDLINLSLTFLLLNLFAGGCCRSASKTMVVGGWAWAWFLITDVQRLLIIFPFD